MSALTAADSIRILISTDNHVGYNERDPQRGDDSWKTFDEIMGMAKERDVDMVLLAGDLFHENKPSRKSMYQVMRSLREHCFGDKPCELEMLSDGSEHFAGHFNHVNYHDQDINVAIPVFSIHGNHDDPSGEGHLAALDLLAMSGLLNYYGRTPESDNIEVKPLLLQKGRTKLALYGMSNVRDERLFRTFRDGKVKFFQPSDQTGDFFNIMSVHQNHHAYTETSYLPEQFLPSFMDLIIWGHEHECKIDPQPNPEMGFKVMQPGSSVATSLVKGEAVPKHVAVLTVTGTDFEVEPIRLKTVRPFIMKDIALKDYEEMRNVEHDDDNTIRITQFLEKMVFDLIDEANGGWTAAQEEAGVELDEDDVPPLPLIRLRIEISGPTGGVFKPENPQRFSNRFAGYVANQNDVVQFHRKRSAAAKASKAQPNMPEDEVMAQVTIESVKVDKLVKEFLTAQSLTILPQNRFSDAVGQFVDKDDKHAMEEFITESLKDQQKHLEGDDEEGEEEELDEEDFDDMEERMEGRRLHQEQAHAKGELRRRRTKGRIRPKPAAWDSDEDGHWEDNPASFPVNNEDLDGQDDDDDASVASEPRHSRARGSRGGRGGKAVTGTTRKNAAVTKNAPAKAAMGGRGKKKQPPEHEDEDDNVIMLDEDDNDESQNGLFLSETKPTTSRSRMQRPEPPAKKAAAKAPAKSSKGRIDSDVLSSARQTQLNFGTSQVNGRGRGTGTQRTNGTSTAVSSSFPRPPSMSKQMQISDDEISDDNAFEPPPPAQRSSRTARR